MSIKEELLALREAQGGILRVEPVVEWAQAHPTSDLHKSLEWDDEKAGFEWRCHQVRRLIAVHVVNEEGERQMVSLTIDRVRPGGGYRDIQDVGSVPNLREVMLGDALDELERVQARYNHLQELVQIWEAADQVRQRHPRRHRRGRPENRSTA